MVQLGLGLAWITLLASRAGHGGERSLTAAQVVTMLLLAGWLPSIALASWQLRHRRWRALVMSDLFGAGMLVLLACTAYLPLFFINVVWFLPFALLPRGVLTECVLRLPWPSSGPAKDAVATDPHSQTNTRNH